MRALIGRALAASLGLSLASAATPALAWGPAAHRVVTQQAIGTLPKPLAAFYKAHRMEMPSLSLEDALPEESPDRRFAIDRLMPFPFADVPHDEASLKQRYPDAAASVGRLPWLINESYARLVEAFKAGDKQKILDESDLLGGLAADVRNPLALLDNYDGQKTGQHGLWVRFSVKLPDALQKQLNGSPEAARYLDDHRGYVFAMINGTYVWADNLLYLEDLSRRTSPGYGDIYFDVVSKRLGPFLRERLAEAASDAGSYWYSAWTDAGRPALPGEGK